MFVDLDGSCPFICRPHLTTAELAGELAGETGRLERLAFDDGSSPGGSSVAAAFGLSYRRLSDEQARLFRLLSAAPGPDTSTGAAAVLTGLPHAETRALLVALARAHLIEPAPAAPGRWRMHDLVALYARQTAGARASPDDRDQAIDRLLGYYLEMARAADAHARALPGAPVPDQFADRDQALAWLDSERAILLAAVSLAAGTGRGRTAMRLPVWLAEYPTWRRRFDDQAAAIAVSLSAARRLNDRENEAAALICLSSALGQTRRFNEAITACQDAAASYHDTSDRHGEAMALNNLEQIRTAQTPR